ncbi:MAG TPA: glucoamylase family protein [Thermoanaerobaculia bacterium]|nr:glucoamylase family protein [Thermoanaerobaculia bacterium]
MKIGQQSSFASLPEPIREELWSVERLEQHALSLGERQRVRPGRRWGDPRLRPRLRVNGRVLLASYRTMAEAMRDEQAITPAAEWLVDNFHLVEDQVREIREDLPPGFYRELPKLTDDPGNEPFQGYPRVYALAHDFVAHTDSLFDAEVLRRFIAAYQTKQPLTIGELWAVAISLRLVLVENLRRLAERMVRARAARRLADELADKLLDEDDPPQEAALLRRFEDRPLDVPFVVALLSRLRDRDPAETTALGWLHQRLQDQETTAEQVLADEYRRQTTMNATVRNVITSMRLISAFNWAGFFESLSLVDVALAAYAGYPAMEFETRDRYRHAVEELAHDARLSEIEVARRAVKRAAEAPETRPQDPGYDLISSGRPAFERELGARLKPERWLRRTLVKWATPGYLGAFVAITALVLAIPLGLESDGPLRLRSLILLGLLALVPASDLAIQLVNAWVTRQLGPRIMPRLELRDGVPPELRTLVVVPTLLTNPAEIEEQINRLEVHYLANPEAELRFALLSDWRDADEESMPEDEELLAAATAGIARLNDHYGPAPAGDARFLIFHRRRVWDKSEQSWIGWERKRGKLEELNRLLRGATDTTFLSTPGLGSAPPGIVYVLTLDADTRLPREAARRLIGTLAHPLNRPRFDARRGRVAAGYGVLQPRITATLPDGHDGSIFQRISSGPAGIDPYAAAVSDLYQDLFGEGSFTGKGIYDVDAFTAALDGKVPADRLLSHDLFEGIFARAGLVTDVELFEEFPAHFEAAAARQHRWARGDWQLLPWILGRGPTAAGGRLRTRIPVIGRFKMLDNLRRTLWAPAAFLTLLAGWTLPSASPTVWTGFVLGTVALPAILRILGGLIPRRPGISKRSHFLGVLADIRLAACQVALTITFLSHQAWLMMDAIWRTLVRLYVSHRRLLQWVTAAQAKAGLGLSLELFYRRMDGGVTFAGVAASAIAITAALRHQLGSWQVWGWPAPLLVLWVLAPAIARWISLPPALEQASPLLPEDKRTLRLIARRTWRFFETFVGPEDHALPPDNFQNDPRPEVAHRTSPTNLGLYLLSVVAARDLGWLGIVDCVSRLEETLETMGGLERCHGHFFNWYATRDLRALEPRYVSTVDSGNLAGHLLTLAEACRQLREQPLLGRQALLGIGDAVEMIREAAPASAGRRTQTVTRSQLDEALAALAPALDPEAALPETPAEWAARLEEVTQGLHAVEDVARALSREQKEGADAAAWGEALAWAEIALACVESHKRDLGALGEGLSPSAALVHRLEEAGRVASGFFTDMDFRFLYDPSRKLFSIGRVEHGDLDPSFYDLLASEARLASFTAVAKGEVPVAHWFHLGRPLTPVSRGAALISWSGSMFEYLMPALVMRSPAHSLLDQTCRLVVKRQIQYGDERRVPWGVSESAFNARDLELTYQYSNFGVPGLGLKRGLSEDVVVAPYATALAAMFDPQAAIFNFADLRGEGGRGLYGFYEAIDYTASRLPEGKDLAVVHAYMAHHQGMTLLALANVLDAREDGAMPARFHASPLVQATELLLQERTPRDVAVARPRAEEVEAAAARSGLLMAPVVRRYRSPHHPVPRSHLLGNGRYAVMLTAAGSGYSRFRYDANPGDPGAGAEIAITRFREDTTRDCWGTFVFFRDPFSGEVWSASYQASGAEPDSYEAIFSEDRAEIVRRDGAIGSKLEVVVAPEDDAELRRVSLTNHGLRPREIELTSYTEVVLAPPAADLAHPAFSNLFVETEWIANLGALLASRRPRSEGEPRLWAAHVAAVSAESAGRPGALEFETDRARFLGRGRGVRSPVSVTDGLSLSNTAGAVLDPVFSLRRRVLLAPGTTARVTFTTLVATSREAAITLADKYRDPAAFERAAAMAWTQAQVQLRHLGILPEEASLFQRIANRVIYSDPSLRAPVELLARNTHGAPALWVHGISGDLPIVLVRIDEIEDVGVVRQLLKAHEYFRAKGLATDLVILNEKAPSYVQDLQAALEALVRRSSLHHEGRHPQGNAFILRADLLTPEVRDVLMVAARAVLQARDGNLFEQLERRARAEERRALPALRFRRFPEREASPAEAPPADFAPPRPTLELWNGLGGFAADGREYVTVLGEGQWTPVPWINVVANPGFGFQVSESGAGYTWSGNSRENQLTPWSNDPVSDPPGETFYVRDEESGLLWGPTVLPIREEKWPYVAHHGQGYSRFEHTSHGVTLELLQFVPRADTIKISRLTIENHESRPRRLSVTAYAEWVLGNSRSAAAPFVVTEIDGQTGAMLARNAWNGEFGSRLAFAALSGGSGQTTWTADRTEFLGRNGTHGHPASLERGDRLSGRAGAGLDPCCALQTGVELRANSRTEIVFLLGQGGGIDEVRTLVERYRKADLDAVLGEVSRFWEDVSSALQVKTPDRSMDLLLNRWLLYQTLSCRVWARSAFYQAGGAFGFRDQLQDVMALTVARREVTREQILRSASRQFVEGDVQHWWHPPSGRGVRTHMSDDLLWLPFALLHYMEVTGEETLLDETVPFLEGAPLPAEQEDAYFVPNVSAQRGTLFEHCARALDRSLAAGRHGLPLMGTGDWNDGMNRIGRLGKGESVWLGWFLHPLLVRFAQIAETRGERKRAKAWRRRAGELATALEQSGWDGAWYRRAYFDDGTPVGSAQSEECRIDSIAQSWAVLSGAGEPGHAAQAMEEVYKQLVHRADGGLVLLFTPPFDRTPLDPGYIKGYLPGVRENGGQYTHAAVWCILAFAALGDGDKASELFSIVNPINHGKTRTGIQRYKVEPYVIAGDVYAEPTHVGRGGWTWYTGSAGWMYRAGIEAILGFRLRGTTLVIDPTIPRAWPGYEITFRYHAAEYVITVENPRGVMRGVTSAELDGAPLPVAEGKGAEIGLVTEGAHRVRVVLG